MPADRVSFSPGLGFTRLSRRVLVALVALYVVQLLAQNWLHVSLQEWLAWWPFDSGQFLPWQLVTCFLLNGDPMTAFFGWLWIFFILPSVEQMFNARSLAWATVTTAAVSVATGSMLLLGGAVTAPGPWYGLGPFLTALTVLFGLSRPNAQILLFFILPIRAGWLAWGTGLLALLYLLAYRTLDAAMWVGGWLGAYAWLQVQLPGGVRRPFMKAKQWWIQRRLQRFQVYEGGRDPVARRRDDDDLVH